MEFAECLLVYPPLWGNLVDSHKRLDKHGNHLRLWAVFAPVTADVTDAQSGVQKYVCHDRCDQSVRDKYMS